MVAGSLVVFAPTVTAPAHAATYAVPGTYATLADAIAAANANPGLDTIVLEGDHTEPDGGVGSLEITDDLIIDGGGNELTLTNVPITIEDGFTGNVSFEGVTINASSAGDGVLASAMAAGSSLTFTDTVVYGAIQNGVRIVQFSSGELVINNSEFRDNGAGLAVDSMVGSTVTINDSHFDENGYAGGVLALVENSEVTIQDSTFNDNVGFGFFYGNAGGASEGLGGVLDISGSEFNGNGDGGAYIHGATEIDITGSEFNDNGEGRFNAQHHSASVSTVSISNSEASRNGDTNSGGVGFTMELTGEGVTEVTLHDLTTTGNGTFGVYIYDRSGTAVREVEILRLNSSESGSAEVALMRDASNGTWLVQDSSLYNGQGMGLFVFQTNPGNVTRLVSSTVAGNRGDTESFTDGVDVSGVFAVFGGENENETSTFEILNSTITSDSDAVPHVALVVFYGIGFGAIENSIIFGGGQGEFDLYTADGDGGSLVTTVDYSLIGTAEALTQGVIAAGTGNLYDAVSPINPQLGALGDNGGTTPTRLPVLGSPVIDAGDPAFTGLSNDQRGQARVFGSRIDMGAVETNYLPPVDPEAPVVVTDPEDATAPVGGSVTFTAEITGGTPGETTVQWEVSTDGCVSWVAITDGAGVSGATTDTLSLTDLTLEQDGNCYRAVYTDPQGTVTTASATLTVMPAGGGGGGTDGGDGELSYTGLDSRMLPSLWLLAGLLGAGGVILLVASRSARQRAARQVS